MRRRRAGLVGLLLLPGWALKLGAAVLAITMVISVSGDTILGGAERERQALASLHGPGQRWGTAEQGDHITGKPNNRSLPDTVRSRYPKQVWNQDAGNAASEVTAQAQEPRDGYDAGTSKEIPEARNANERVYNNTDGTQTTEFSTGKLNYRKDGAWTPIDPALVGDPSTGWRNKADEIDLRFAATATAPDLVRLKVDQDHEVSYSLAGAAQSAPKVDGTTITYPNVQSKVDLKLDSQPGGVKETLVLTGPDAPTTFTFPLRLKGLTPRIDGRQVVFTDASGAQRAVIPAGTMIDAHDELSTGVSYRLTQGALEVSIDPAWLKAAGRAFPVEVDPTIQLPVNGGTADSSLAVRSGGSSSGADEFSTGPSSAGYIKFTDLVNRLQFHTIFGAQLWLVNFDAESCNPRPVSVHPVTESWSSGDNRSYPGPSVGGALATRSFAHGYIAFGQPGSACPRSGELFNLGAGGRDLVQRWVNGDQANNGLSIRGSASKRFTGQNTANPPRLYVTHSPYNASYKLVDPRPNPPVLQNQDGKVKITVTNKSATAWAPSDYYLAYRAYKDDGTAVGQQRSASLAGSVPRNGKVTLDATIKAMPPGKYFLDFTMVRTGGPVFTDHQVPPARIVLQVFDIPPVLQELFPPNGYQAPTLTPQLWARALDIDAPPSSSLQFKYEICERDPAGKPVNCVNSGYGTKTAWTVGSGTLSWSKQYMWRAFVKDATTEVPSPYSVLLTNVPQPEITAHVSSAPDGMREQDFDPQTGNYTTAAVDATVATVGPQLTLTRTYNSVDPRRDGLFGAGWTSAYDMKLVTDDDGSGNAVVTYPDGQTVRFGRNANGTYAAPTGRSASLTTDSTGWKLLDKSGTTYTFAVTGKLTKITDISNRSVNLTYTSGLLSKAQVSNSQTNTQGRSLFFTWTGNHVTNVKTDAVNGTPIAWNYSYTGDLLKQVCGPTTGCTSYDYSQGSHYRSSVLDSRPESYWRLGESEGTQAGSEVAVNLGKDTGTYKNVILAQPGQLAGTTDTAASFNGTTSSVDLPKGTVKKSRDGAIELWFKNSITGSGGPLVGYQDKALGSASAVGVPVLYVGTDGKLHGQFATGSVAPINSAATVNDGKWHHAVLSSMGTTQTLYLDGVKAGESTGKTIDHTLLTFNQIGAAYASTPASWPGWGTTAQRSYDGLIDEVAIYSGPLGAASVTAHYKAGITQADQISKVTLPSGRVDAVTTYDTGRDRVKEYVDSDGGTWKVGAPTVYGGDTDLRRSVEVLDPGNRTSLYEFDAIGGQLLRLGMPLGMEARPEDAPGEPKETPPDPVRTCTQPDPKDPAFCTVIPNDSGGPVFVRYGVDGVSIRSFFYDDSGQLNQVTDENGDSTSMTYDARGNVTSTKTCRVSSTNECYTSYKTYPTTVTNAFDPRNDLPTESRDARSSSATDTTYRTQYTYHSSGQLASATAPDGSTSSYKYTTGSEAAVGGGTEPAGLLDSTTNGRGKMTRYAYYSNGDLGKVTSPLGLVTEYTYDAIGRLATRKDTSDSFPSGVVTTYTYDGMSRVRTTTSPVTTNAVTNVQHQQKVTNNYDPDGNVLSVETSDVLGHDTTRTTSSQYDEHGRPITVTDPEGGETGYDYDVFGNVTSKTDPNGNRYDFAYTARNDLAEVRLRNWHSDPEGVPSPGEYLVVESRSYDFGGRLASTTDAMGRRVEYEYYDDGLLHRSVLKKFHNPDGSTRDFVLEDNTYDATGNVTKKVTDNGKTTTTSTPDKLGRVQSATGDPGGLTRVTSFTYDGNGNVKSVTSTGKPSNVPWVTGNSQEQVSYDYDDGDNLIQESITSGSTTRVTKTKFDQRGLAVSTTDARGTTDPTAYTSNIAYDELGQVVTSTAPPVSVESNGNPASVQRPTASSGYNTFGELTDYKDERGFVSTTAYDRNGRVVSKAAPAYNGRTPTVTTKYDGNGNAVEVKDARDNIVRNTYDQLDRLTSVDAPASTNDERAVTKYAYTRSGQLLSTVDPAGARTETTYDDFDRPVTATEIERKPTAGVFTMNTTYDDADNVTLVTTPQGAATRNTYDNLGQLTKTIDPNNVTSEFGYDYAGRQVRVMDGLGRTSQTVYDQFGQKVAVNDLKADGSVLRTTSYGYDMVGNLTTVTDPNKAVRTYAYDAANNMVQQIDPVDATKTITTSSGYDASGNRTRYTDGRNNATITTYNSLGLPESTIDPSTQAHPNDRTFTVGYDLNGNAVSLAAPGGVSTQRTYDAANRPTLETGTGAESPTANHSWGYDLADHLMSVSAVNGTNTYTYDDRGHMLSTAGPGGTATYRYDSDGNPSSRTDASGTATFSYPKDRLESVVDGLTGTTQKIGYDPAGMVKTVDYGSGRVRTVGYDDLGRLTSDTLANSAKATVSSIGYGYNPTDTIASKTTTGMAGPASTTYDYDSSNRLKSSTAGGVTTGYEWDDAGNRTKIGGKSASYDERNRLQSDGDSTYTYTARGTLKSKTTNGQTQQYGFDAFDRMVSAGAQTYAYDGFDRVGSRNGTQFTYAGQGKEIVSDGAETYARGPEDELLAVGKGADKQLSLSDSHGDVVAGFDPADNTLAALSDSTGYDPFGKVTGRTGDTGSLGYQGDWTDAATGQVDMGARWYDPNTGGFASRDSVDSTNRYGYAAGNPVTNNDPTGQYCKTLPVVHTPVCVSKPKTSWLKKSWGWAKKGGKWGLGRISLVGTIIINKITINGTPECTDRHSWDYCMALFGNYPSYSTNARDQFCDTHSWTSQCGGNGRSPWTLPNGDPDTDTDGDPDTGTDPGNDDAAKRAAEERYRAWLRAKAISDHARAANEAAAKHTPIPVAPGATKPVTLMPTPVSSSPKLPAGKVVTTRDVVKDAKADAEAIYQNAVRAVGQLQQDVSNAAQVIVTTISALTNPYGPRVNNSGRRRQDCRQQLPTPNYMPVDSAHGNRATGVEACITQLSPDRNSAMYGPGYRWTQNYVKLNFGVKASSTINSCHLLASQFFGDGSRPENVATCSRAANYHVRGVGRLPDNMYRYESQVAGAVRSGQDVYYKVIPRYAGARTVPVSFEVTAEGYYRDGRPGGINVHDVVPNILYNPRGRRGGTPGAINLGLLNDLNGRPAPVGNIR